MPFARAALMAPPAVLVPVSVARAEDGAAPGALLGLGTQFGMVLVALLALLIGLSVAAKLLIVFGAVPRQPESGLHALVHAMANFVGGLTRPRPRRRQDGDR